ncbi:MAG: TraR/DksA C4-type zinc finger protein [Desulfobulbaceae bacterium]|jgi:DnaK suppressor protein|nr:TraR/DksA C4-type zinc finger protein [Desulfobulbaceae bacterium]
MRDDLDGEDFRKRLEERRAAILAGQETRKGGTPVELDQARMGRLSRMDALQQQEMDRAAARLSDLELQRIETALRRLDTGDYGYCVMCDDEIAEGRLRFDPSVLTCISCARKAESK